MRYRINIESSDWLSIKVITLFKFKLAIIDLSYLLDLLTDNIMEITTKESNIV